jgi:hypothetical protein
MKRILFALQLLTITLLLMVSCKPKATNSQQNGNSIGTVPVETERTAHVLSFDDKALYDTLSYSNIIQSVNYIPLETRQEAFIGHRVNGIKRMRDKYIIMSRNGMTPSFKLFNADGTYYTDALTIGRGPIEMTFFSSYTFNDSTGLITFLDSEGGKAVKMDMASLEKKRFSVTNGTKYARLVALDNGNYLSLATNYDSKRTADKPVPFMYLLNQDFQIVDSLCDMVNREKKTIEGVTDGPELQVFLSQYPGGAIYKDMLNDTVFFIDNNLHFKPIAIFDFGKRKPTLKESNNDSWEKKMNKIYIRNVDVMDDYIHVTYDYDKLFYEAIWSLESGQLLYQSSLDLIGINVSCDSFHGRMPINNYIGNKLCFPANAADLITVIPGLKPDDNVVLVEITLNN